MNPTQHSQNETWYPSYIPYHIPKRKHSTPSDTPGYRLRDSHFVFFLHISIWMAESVFRVNVVLAPRSPYVLDKDYHTRGGMGKPCRRVNNSPFIKLEGS